MWKHVIVSSALLVAAVAWSGCENDDRKDTGENDMAQVCDVVDESPTEWTDHLNDYGEIGAYVDGYARKYEDATINDQPVTIEIARGEGKPLRRTFSDGCGDQVRAPITIRIDADTSTWSVDTFATLGGFYSSSVDLQTSIEDASFFEQFGEKPEHEGDVKDILLSFEEADGVLQYGYVLLNVQGTTGSGSDASVFDAMAPWLTIDLYGCGEAAETEWNTLHTPAADWLELYLGSHTAYIGKEEQKTAEFTLERRQDKPTQRPDDGDMCTDFATLPLQFVLSVDGDRWVHALDVERKQGRVFVSHSNDVWDEWAGFADPESVLQHKDDQIVGSSFTFEFLEDGEMLGDLTVLVQSGGEDGQSVGSVAPVTIFTFSVPAAE